ncbi:MAG TPA: hypothetical protein VK131_07930 [Candidatus Acidoferrales bacterium]|nr:hypothetical protein [Candidatus Acidoferrales bacterium]
MGERAAPNPGLCASCRHSKTVAGAHSRFWMCLRSRTEPSFPRYPRLPVLSCRGYEQRELRA